MKNLSFFRSLSLVLILSVLLLNSGTTLLANELVPIDVNIATAEELAATLKGVGRKKAERIVAYRNEHGRFSSVADMANVKGIGAHTIEKNYERMSVSE